MSGIVTEGRERILELARIVNFCDDANAIELAELILAEPDPARRAGARAIEIVRETRDGFLSEEYATGQPVASFLERFACEEAALAIENEFGLGAIEQCRLLGKPTPFEAFSAANTPSGLDAEGMKDV